MKDKQLYLYWLYLFILCAALGFIPPERNALVTAALAMLCILFYVPGAILLYRAIRSGKRLHLRNVLIISASSLALTTLVFIANMLTVMAPANRLLGNIFNAALVVVSSPMMCSPLPGGSLFLWACLMFTAISYWKKTKN